MKNIVFSALRELRKSTKEQYLYNNRTIAFKKRYRNIDSSLFENNLSDDVIDSYIEKWKVLNRKVETDTFLLCHNLSGIIDLNIVPENIFAAIIEPKINKYRNDELSFLAVKNVYEKWFNDSSVFPKTYLHKIDNIYYDNMFDIIDRKDLDLYLDQQFCHSVFPIICKPSLGTYGGEGVIILKTLREVKESLSSYDNLVFQEKIIQHPEIEYVYPSMNSIRSCLYRKDDGFFTVLNNTIRFGVNGSLDNETAGGIFCNINSDGKLNDYALNKYCEKHYKHPNSHIKFTDIKIPKYDELMILTKNIANQIPLCNLVSLDMCLDNKGNWRCIEVNLNGQTIRFRQYAGYGFFGEHTDEIIKKVSTGGYKK